MILADNIIRSITYFILWLFIIALSSCENSNELDNEKIINDHYLEIQGTAQGTTFSIIYNDSLQRDLSSSIDSILNKYDLELSIYIDSSMISEFNNEEYNPICIIDRSSYFRSCFTKAKIVYHNTNGAFNPAVFPLIKYWGFYRSSYEDVTIDSNEIDSILKLTSFNDEAFFITVDTLRKREIELVSYPVVCKTVKNAKLDFNGIAQGHSVDIISDYFDLLEIQDYFIEIGGEITVKGRNPKKETWKIGIDRPVENASPGANEFQLIVALNDLSLATSGNYRKFYIKDGVKYSHTIDPKTGYPVQHSLLSVTVIHDQAAIADAYATAFMVMGVDKAKGFIKNNTELELEAYFVYSDIEGENKVWMSSGMDAYVVD
jgi:thiamine biosynthesis lipoprotein